MNRAFSTYLDFLRFGAAVLVLLHHFVMPQLGGQQYAWIGSFGEDAVMIFFVLSGYVIAYVAAEREKTLQSFSVSRLARLYSVVVPALLLTFVADQIGRAAEPALYDGWYRDSYLWIKTAVSLSFTNQLWSFDIRFLSNLPYWSISYEFWYYALFACVAFAPARARLWLCVLWALFVGPGILLLLPVWWLGVTIYRLNQRYTLPLAAGVACFVLPVIAYLLYQQTGWDDFLTAVTDTVVISLTGDVYFLHKARFFLHDYIVGLMVAVHFLGAHSLLGRIDRLPAAVELPVRSLAAYTFSLYLFHYPLLFCLAAVSPWQPGQWQHSAVLLCGTAALVWLVGSLTEGRKDAWRRLLNRLWTAAAKHTGRLARQPA